MEDPADHPGHGRLAAGPADRDAALGIVEQLREELGPGEVGQAELARPDDVGNIVLDRRRGDQGHARLEARAVLREQLDPERAQIVELVRRPAGVERAVGARDAAAGRAHDARQRKHPAAADTAEEDGRIDHRRGPICGRRKWLVPPSLQQGTADLGCRPRRVAALSLLMIPVATNPAFHYIGDVAAWVAAALAARWQYKRWPR